MSIEVKIPPVGESITSGLVSTWHKAEGETVAEGDVLLTLETDKVSTEITAEAAGVLKIIVPEGEEVDIGTVVATIDPEGGATEAKAAPAEKPAQAPAKEEAPAPAPVEEPPVAKAPEAPAPAPAAPAPAPKPASTALVPSTPATVAIPEGRTTRKRMSPLRRKIAAQLVMAQQTAAMLTTFNEADMSGVMGLRKRLQEEFVAQHGVKLGFMSFFIKASVHALKAVPGVNSRIDGEDLITNHFYDIGVAVGTERGLIVPVIRDADQKSFAEIEKDIIEYAGKAREGKIKVEDLQGGVFTISNGGVYGSLLSTPILNPPQSGILGLHKIQERPIAEKGQVVIRPMMNLALSYDHRVIDGKEAVTFLIKIKEAIEDPMRLLLDF
ncbi:MAG TPA: dihydrolipoyllysine-residue succinyltransferase [Chthoniobacteraceae bacterium]|nr:dihydrolipoyllysine-residue succinyltransferase [Chthoniobacteraceae bacterium]